MTNPRSNGRQVCANGAHRHGLWRTCISHVGLLVIPRMSKYDDVERQARALSKGERAAVARVLIDELDPVSDPGVEDLWIEEARRRYDAYRRGEMHFVPGNEPMARALSRIR